MPLPRWAAENTQPSVQSTHLNCQGKHKPQLPQLPQRPQLPQVKKHAAQHCQALAGILMHPWFALPLTPEQGSEYECSDCARSKTQPAIGPSRTPPLGTYTMKPWCPCRGGRLRIHSQASKAPISTAKKSTSHNCPSCLNCQRKPKPQLPQLPQRPQLPQVKKHAAQHCQALAGILMHPWFALPLTPEQGSEYECSALLDH